MLDEIELKTMHEDTKMQKVIDKGKRSKALREVKPVENISKNLQSFLEKGPGQKEVLHLIEAFLTRSKNVRRI